MDLDSDEQLVRRMLDGEQRAFDEFFNAYFDRLYRFALARLDQDTAAAEDVVQQTLCRAVQKMEQFRGESALFTWLCTLCRNAIADMFRARGRPRGDVIPFDETDEIRLALESLSGISADDPQQAMMSEQVSRAVQLVLDYLPKHYSDVLEWKYMQGLSVKEIAQRLSVGPKAAESVLARAKKAFKEGFGAIGNSAAIAQQLGMQS